MGSSKTANAIMVRYNYMERGQKALMIKSRVEGRDGDHTVRSRSGFSAPCEYMEDLARIDVTQYDCLIVDDAQFLSREQVKQLVEIVDEKSVPVICYGLRADFRGELFPGSAALLAWADAIEEVKTVCWCGKKATFNTRIENGRVVREGAQVVLGGNESYVSLCRKHWTQGNLGEREIRRIDADKKRFLNLLMLADPDEAMLDKYLGDGEMYVLFEGGIPVAEAVVLALPDGTCELKNLATDPDRQGRGLARELVRHLCELYRSRGTMYVGTGASLMGFYERLGFRYDRTLPGFFADNYPDPIYDQGELLTDMQILARPLTRPE
jgi:thymidine kinase